MKAANTSFVVVLLLSLYPLQASELGEPEVFTQAELDQMLAPIALYPDSLLVQILMASTYPLEVVEAARWSKRSGFDGAKAVEAVSDQDWDPSVKALVAFPNVLAHMDEDLEWTKNLGDAFLLQEESVMDTVQGLRQKAYAAGNLKSSEQVRVVREREVIMIQPANPRVVYVPYYPTTVVYGDWWWPSYPPVYWRMSTGYYTYPSTYIVWSSGFRVSTVHFYSRPDWHRRHIVVIHSHQPRTVRVRETSGYVQTRYVGGERWRHDATHRRGVGYRAETLTDRYGRSTASGFETSDRWREMREESDPLAWTSREDFRRSLSREERSPATVSSHPRRSEADRESTSTWSRRQPGSSRMGGERSWEDFRSSSAPSSRTARSTMETRSRGSVDVPAEAGGRHPAWERASRERAERSVTREPPTYGPVQTGRLTQNPRLAVPSAPPPTASAESRSRSGGSDWRERSGGTERQTRSARTEVHGPVPAEGRRTENPRLGASGASSGERGREEGRGR